jgi:hypothetical protein
MRKSPFAGVRWPRNGGLSLFHATGKPFQFTFITLTLRDPRARSRKWQEHCGTSVEMIEKHYAKPGLRPETVARLGGAVPVVRRLTVVA